MNVTNLLDTAFILLMAFMIVAPSIKHGIELELPTVSAQNMDTKKTVTVVVQRPAMEGAAERIYIDDKRLSLEDLEKELIEQKIIFPQMDVVIEADKNVSYGSIASTLGAIKAAGIEGVGLATLPPGESRGR